MGAEVLFSVSTLIRSSLQGWLLSPGVRVLLVSGLGAMAGLPAGLLGSVCGNICAHLCSAQEDSRVSAGQAHRTFFCL